jgi:hypothetical protein
MNHQTFTLTVGLLTVIVVRAVPGLAATPCEDLTKLSLF